MMNYSDGNIILNGLLIDKTPNVCDASQYGLLDPQHFGYSTSASVTGPDSLTVTFSGIEERSTLVLHDSVITELDMDAINTTFEIPYLAWNVYDGCVFQSLIGDFDNVPRFGTYRSTGGLGGRFALSRALIRVHIVKSLSLGGDDCDPVTKIEVSMVLIKGYCIDGGCDYFAEDAIAFCGSLTSYVNLDGAIIDNELPNEATYKCSCLSLGDNSHATLGQAVISLEEGI